MPKPKSKKDLDEQIKKDKKLKEQHEKDRLANIKRLDEEERKRQIENDRIANIRRLVQEEEQKRLDALEEESKKLLAEQELKREVELKLKQEQEQIKSDGGDITKQVQDNSILGEGGDNESHDDALYDDEIEDIMKPYKRFLGVVSSDRVNRLDPDKEKDSAFIMNLDEHDEPGSHWIAVYISPVKSKSIEYYDSFGEEPDMGFLRQIKKVIDKMDLDYLLKLKVNRIKKQAETSSECGYYAMNFIMDRFKGLPFDDSTGYSDVIRAEGRIKKFKNMLRERYPKFDFI